MRVKEFSFPDGYVEARLLEHWQMAEEFMAAFERDYFDGRAQPESHVGINEERLALAVSSAYQDIVRYKVYHQENPKYEKLDCVKRCAFLLKWFVRLKPLYVKQPSNGVAVDASLTPLEMANEFLSLYFFEQHLSLEQECQIELDEIKTAELAYALLYRQMNEDAWVAIFQLIKECAEFGSIEETPFLREIVTLA